MNDIDFYKILMDSIQEQMIRQTLLLILFLFLAVIFCFQYYKIKKALKSAEKDQLLRLKKEQVLARNIIVLAVIGFSLATVCGVPRIINSYKDLREQQFVVIQTEYSRNAHTKRTLFSDGYAVIQINGKNEAFQLPYGWNSNEFPNGNYYAIVCYAKHSKTLLAVKVIEKIQ